MSLPALVWNWAGSRSRDGPISVYNPRGHASSVEWIFITSRTSAWVSGSLGRGEMWRCELRYAYSRIRPASTRLNIGWRLQGAVGDEPGTADCRSEHEVERTGVAPTKVGRTRVRTEGADS